MTPLHYFLTEFGVLFGIFIILIIVVNTKNNRQVFKELDELDEKQGFLTKTQIFNSNFPNWMKHFLIFNLKRSGDYRYEYKLPDNTTYEYLHDIPEEKRNQAETYFYKESCEDLDEDDE